MLIVNSINGVPVRLTEERWKHIINRHPEMRLQRDRVLQTIAEPDVVQEGDFGELLAIRLYSNTPLTSKFLVVAYREVASDDGFVMTAYLARRLSARRRAIWKR